MGNLIYGVKHHLFEHAAARIKGYNKAGYILTSAFGNRTIKGVKGFHVGCDLVADYDIGLCQGIDNIIAPWGGTVVVEPYHPTSGNVVDIRVNNRVYMTFRHLDKIFVKSGQKVEKGTKIGLMGSTGSASTSAHLHFGIIIDGNDNYVDPIPYLTGAKILPGFENEKVEDDEEMGFPILTKTCKKEENGDHVRAAQIVFQDKWKQPVNGIDGRFGNGMYAGVGAFQSEHGLPVTHEVDAVTIAELNREPADLWRAEKAKNAKAIEILK